MTTSPKALLYGLRQVRLRWAGRQVHHLPLLRQPDEVLAESSYEGRKFTTRRLRSAEPSQLDLLLPVLQACLPDDQVYDVLGQVERTLRSGEAVTISAALARVEEHLAADEPEQVEESDMRNIDGVPYIRRQAALHRFGVSSSAEQRARQQGKITGETRDGQVWLSLPEFERWAQDRR